MRRGDNLGALRGVRAFLEAPRFRDKSTVRKMPRELGDIAAEFREKFVNILFLLVIFRSPNFVKLYRPVFRRTGKRPFSALAGLFAAPAQGCKGARAANRGGPYERHNRPAGDQTAGPFDVKKV